MFHFLLIKSSLLPCLACNQVEIVLSTSSLQWSHVLHLFLDVLQLRTPRSLMEGLERSGSIELEFYVLNLWLTSWILLVDSPFPLLTQSSGVGPLHTGQVMLHRLMEHLLKN